MGRSDAALIARKAIYAIGAASLAAAASAAPPSDSIYIRCDNAGGDFRISDLNHSVSQYSPKSQEYRVLCADCDITEWGDRITMKDGAKTFIQINRVSGMVSVQRNNAKSGSGPLDIYSFQGVCRRGPMVVPTRGSKIPVRAF